MRAAYVIPLTLAFCSLVSAQYGFQFECLDDTIQEGVDYIEFYFAITNTGAQADTYAFDCRITDSIPGWGELYCVGGSCGEPGIILYDPMNPGASDSSIHVMFFLNATPGTEIANLLTWSLANPSLRDSINVYAVLPTGVLEQDADPAACAVSAFPSIADVSCQIAIQDGGLSSRTLHVLNSAGRLVRVLDRAGAPRWTWDLRDDRSGLVPAGVYLFLSPGHPEYGNTKVTVVR